MDCKEKDYGSHAYTDTHPDTHAYPDTDWWLRMRTLLALLASFCLSLALEWLGIATHIGWWLCIDLAVCAVILTRKPPLCDRFALALFVPAWVAYFIDDPWRYWICMAVVTLQFLLVLPYRDLWKRARKTPYPDSHHHFDLREAAPNV